MEKVTVFSWAPKSLQMVTATMKLKDAFALEMNRDHSVAFEIPFKYCKDKSEKVGLKFNIQKTKIMAFGPITSWQIDGETVETVSDFI